MTKDRACANSPAMSRRNLLAALPASGVALALPAHAQPTTPILRLFEQWKVAWDIAENRCADQELNAATDEMIALEDQMMALPSQSVADLAAKIVSYTRWGECPELPPLESPLWDEMRTLLAGRF